MSRASADGADRSYVTTSPLTLRTRSQRWAALALVIASGATLAEVFGAAGVGGRLVLIGVFGVTLLGALRFARTRVEVLDDGIAIVNPIRRHRVRWEDIEDVRLGGFMAIAHLRDGSAINLWGILVSDGLLETDRARQLVAELDEARTGRRRER